MMIDYNRFLNDISNQREPLILFELIKLLAKSPKNFMNLSTGLPNPQLFPFLDMSIKVNGGHTINVSSAAMKNALQYTPTNGFPKLINQMKELQLKIHNPPNWKNTELIMTSGAQDGLCKSLEMILEQDSCIITEEFVYAGALSITKPYRPRYLVIQSDSQGMVPADLKTKLSSRWKNKNEIEKDPRAPKCLYINPTGGNPTGSVLPENRMRQIYEICCDYNLLILEDDPYYYIQFNERKRAPSFLSMDYEGRVLRFDSFSKILSSGIRLGFMTGPKPLVDRVVSHMQASILHASSLSQVITSELFSSWGIDGFLEHVAKVEEFYQRRRDLMNQAALKHLDGLCEWSLPGAGMFLWIKVNGINDTWTMIMKRAMKKNVMLLPGKAFLPDPSRPCPYMRATFSVAPEADFDVAFQRLAEVIKEELENIIV